MLRVVNKDGGKGSRKAATVVHNNMYKNIIGLGNV